MSEMVRRFRQVDAYDELSSLSGDEFQGQTSNLWCLIARIIDNDATSIERFYKTWKSVVHRGMRHNWTAAMIASGGIWHSLAYLKL